MFLRLLYLSLVFVSSFAPHLIAQPCREVVGYYPGWQWYDRSQLVNPTSIDYDQYTIINYAFFAPDTDGNIAGVDAWGDENLLLGPINWSTTPPSHYSQNSLIGQAHAHNVKVLISIGGWTLSNNFPSIAADAVKRNTFAQSCVGLLQTYGFDGIDLDWEYPGFAEHSGTPADGANFVLLLQDVRTAIDNYGTSIGKQFLLTAAVSAAPSVADNVPWASAHPYLDIINLMTYDFYGSWDAIANHNSPLYTPAQGDPNFSTAAAFELYHTTFGIPADKLNIGVAFYGRSLKNCNGLFQPHGGVDNITYWQDEGMPLYYNILANIGGYTPQWDSQAQVPYLTDAAGHRFVSYDNAQSVAIKAQFVADQQARGIIIWEITGDYIQNGATMSTPLADTLNAIFCNAALPRPDLSVVNPSLIPSTVQVGNTISLNTTLYNNGNATANPSEIAFYLSSNTSLELATDLLLTSASVGSIAPTGGTLPFSVIIGIPAYLSAGTWYVIAVADHSQVLTESNENNNRSTATLTLTTPPLPPVADFVATTATQICAGQSVTFNDISSNTPTTWNWTFIGANPAIANTPSATVSYPNAGTYSVSLTSGNAYGTDSETKTAYITVYPAFGVSVPTDQILCFGNSLQLSATATAGAIDSYAWQPTIGLSDAAIANPIAAPTTTTTYTVIVTNAAGCTASDAITLTVAPLTGAINGNTSVAENATAQIYSVPLTPTSTYNWTVPVGASITSGQGTAQISVNFGTLGGVISVTETTLEGCTGAVRSLNVATLGSGGCPSRPATYYPTVATLRPINEIRIGEARLYPVWGVSSDAEIPNNRKSWAMAIAHASQVFANVIDTGILPINTFWATPLKESFGGCDNALQTDSDDPYPLAFQSASTNDGCFQIEPPPSAYAELNGMYPNRFPTAAHPSIIGGNHFETAALGKAYYDIFTVRWLEVNKDWDPLDFFDNATDPMAGVKAISGAYNRGLWSTLVSDIFYTLRDSALAAPDLLTIFNHEVAKDHAEKISNYTQVLGDQAAAINPTLTATNTATGQPYNYFKNYYDEPIAWSDVSHYLTRIFPLYPDIDSVAVRNNIQTTFNGINGGASISFRYEFGQVLNALMLLLPLDDPTEQIKTTYGCANGTGGGGGNTGNNTGTCTVPSNITASNITENSAQITWVGTSNATDYWFFYRAVNGAWVAISSAAATTLLGGLLPNTTYEIMIASNCGGVYTDFSPTATFMTLTTIPCPAPAFLVAPTVSNTSATVVWEAVPGALNYYVEYQDVNGPTWWFFETTANTSTTIYGLTSGTTYKVRVSVDCGQGYTLPTPQILLTPAIEGSTTCGAPTSITIANLTPTSAQLTWNSAAGANGYQVQYQVAGTTAWTSIVVSTNMAVLSGLAGNTNYQVRISSLCGSGSSSLYSAPPVAFGTPAPVNCPIPSGLSASNIATGVATLSWSAVAEAVAYTVQYKTTNTTIWNSAATSNTTYTLSGLTDDTDYEWRIATQCAASALSLYSDISTFSTPTPYICKLKVWLQGAYDPAAALMTTALNTQQLLPLSQPYGGSPWNYNGQEAVPTMPPDVVDWVLVEARLASNTTVVAERRAALLTQNGTVKDIDGTAGVRFYQLSAAANYHIAVRHRNHLAIASAIAPSISNSLTIDLSAADNVMGNTGQLAWIATNTYGMVAGDMTANGVVTVADFQVLSSQMAQMNQYLAADNNLDGNVLVQDFNQYQPNAARIGIQILRY